MSDPAQSELTRVYARRFDAIQDYRLRVWRVLVPQFFQRWIPETATVLDLGCGYGEFINTVKAHARFGMDLNPQTRDHLGPAVRFLHQDCSRRWALADGQLDVVFTSNFFEHLPDKATLGRTLEEAFRCLKPGGRLIALGPNIAHAAGRYWDFWDHCLPLTEKSLAEGLASRGFQIERCEPRFLPYTMSGGPQYPPFLVSLYLRVPLLWRLGGQQFLILARKPLT